jgi:NADPH:quinone reductase-like Zn-dependent oxidoreductase
LHEINQAIQSGLANGTLNPLIGPTFALADAPAAHTFLINPPEGAGATGKVILDTE